MRAGVELHSSCLVISNMRMQENLSTGQAQLLAIARAIAEKRRIVVIDEGNYIGRSSVLVDLY